MNALIHVGTKVDKQGIDAATDAILRILSVHADQKTIRLALKAFKHVVEVPEMKIENVSISNVHVRGDEFTKPYPEADADPDAGDDAGE